MPDLTPLPQTEDTPYPAHCFVCLHIDAKKVPAKWMTTAGYLTCEAHAGFDIEELKRTIWKGSRAT